MGTQQTKHSEFNEVVEYTNKLSLIESSSKDDTAREQMKGVFSLKGLEITYKIVEDDFEVEKKVMLARKNLPTVVDEGNLVFEIHIVNELQQLEQWKLKAQNKKEFTEWLDCIRKAYRPRWVEESASHCWVCEKEFTTFKRQHHCRFCGVAVCSECSKSKFVLPEYAYYEPVKVCDKCAETLKETHKSDSKSKQ